LVSKEVFLKTLDYISSNDSLEITLNCMLPRGMWDGTWLGTGQWGLTVHLFKRLVKEIDVYNKHKILFMKMSNVSICPLWYNVALRQKTFN